MITRTFQHIPGVGPWREKDLWAKGIDRWSEFPEEAGLVISRKVDPVARERIAQARAALDERDLGRLAAMFPGREHWRLYREFREQAVFFDIETDGRAEQRPTVVSLFSAAGLEIFVQERNLEELPGALARFPIWVTFNGTCFDVPVLERHLPGMIRPLVHLDLRFICRMVGLSGGLKAIEDELGIARPLHLRGVNGYDAVLLWRAYQESKDLEALRFLAEYNLYDTFQLRTVMELTYNRATAQLAFKDEEIPVFERGELLYDVSKLLLALGPEAERPGRVLDRARAATGPMPPR